MDDGRKEAGGAVDTAVGKVGGLARQLATAQQITHIGSWEWDIRANTVSWSDELYRIYGLAPQSTRVTLESFLSRLHPDDRARIQAEIGEAIAHGDRFQYPERIVRPDGSIRHLDTIGEVTRDASGTATAMVGTCRDVTEDRARDAQLRLFGDLVRNVQLGLSIWNVANPSDPRSITLAAFNPAAERTSGADLARHVGRSFLDVHSGADAEALATVLADVARTREVHDLESSRFANRDGARTFRVKVFPLPSECVGVAFEDVTAESRARAIQDIERRVLELIASGAGLDEVLTTLVLRVEAHAPPAIGSVLLLDAEGKHVVHGAAPHLPDGYNRAIDGAPIGPAAGSCGTAAFRRASVFVTDVEIDPLWNDYRDLARRFGLRACWSTPILASDGRVLGTFALYYREPREASPDDRELISRATHVAAIAIERRQLDDQFRALSARIESAREDERTGIAREIHDQLGQAMTALKMDLAWLARRIEGPDLAPREALSERLRSMLAMTDEIIQQVRRISTDLRPGVLDDLGLTDALEWQAAEFERQTGAACTVTSNTGDRRFDRAVSTAVFRIVQESLTNVTRHARAHHVEVSLDASGDDLSVVIRDDGVGIAPEIAARPTSLGILGMRERAARLGGTLGVAPGEHGGTVLRLRVPIVAASGRSA